MNKVSGKKIQDAHEAIRPTYVELTPVVVKDSLARDQFRLYQLIWKRFIASRMQPAKYETATIKIDGGGYRFTASSSHLIFEGFMFFNNISSCHNSCNGWCIGTWTTNSKFF
mgnify:CR=1 FL=1